MSIGSFFDDVSNLTQDVAEGAETVAQAAGEVKQIAGDVEAGVTGATAGAQSSIQTRRTTEKARTIIGESPFLVLGATALAVAGLTAALTR